MQWVEVLNQKCIRARREGWEADRAQIRQAVLERLKTELRFPHHVEFRGYVTKERVLKLPRLQAHVSGQRTEGEAAYLEMVPERYAQDAYHLVGGLLVPYERRLQPGSVLEVAVDILDPTSYRLSPPGLICELVRAKVVVGVEA